MSGEALGRVPHDALIKEESVERIPKGQIRFRA
jgi:hypothetical protein